MFIRAKRQGERTYYYAVESERIGNRVRQKTIAYLGEKPSVVERITQLEAWRANYLPMLERAEKSEAHNHRLLLCYPAHYARSVKAVSSLKSKIRSIDARLEKLRACSDQTNASNVGTTPLHKCNTQSSMTPDTNRLART
jgi:hypothetical protein